MAAALDVLHWLTDQVIGKVMATATSRPELLKTVEHQVLARGMMQDRDEIAKRHGCASGDELLAISEPIPMMPCDAKQIYIARPANGLYFVWVGEPQSEAPVDETKRTGALTAP